MFNNANSLDNSSSNPAEDQHWIWCTSAWTGDEMKSIRANAMILMEAAGESMLEVESSKSLPEFLQKIVVGTECRKAWKERTKLQPKPSDLGPISKMKFMSTAKQALLATRRAAMQDEDNSENIIGHESNGRHISDN